VPPPLLHDVVVLFQRPFFAQARARSRRCWKNCRRRDTRRVLCRREMTHDNRCPHGNVISRNDR
jgi:hypothetical protein